MISLPPCALDPPGSSAFHLLFRTQQHTLSGFNWEGGQGNMRPLLERPLSTAGLHHRR